MVTVFSYDLSKMSGIKTPRQGDSGSDSGDEGAKGSGSAVQSPVERTLKNSAMGKSKKLNITKFWFDWAPPTDYKSNAALAMPAIMSGEEQWAKWFKSFMNYLMFVQCAFQFFDIGVFQYPMEIW